METRIFLPNHLIFINILTIIAIISVVITTSKNRIIAKIVQENLERKQKREKYDW